MKKLVLLLLISGAIPCYGNNGGFIRQIQTINGQAVIYDMPITSDNGTVVSNPLTAESAVFQLYTNVAGPNNTQTLTKLDERVVGTFLPTASATILSEDPYFPPRTRADKPYGVRLVVSKLLPNSPDVPAYAKTVHVKRSYKIYNPATFQPNGLSGAYADEFSFRQNGTYVDNGILQRLPGASPSKAVGEESFTVYLHPDAGPSAELSKATVQIWPIATAEISEIEEGKTYASPPAKSNFSVKNLYPSSVTYAQVYPGPQQTGSTGTPLPLSVVAYNTHAPQSALLPMSDLGKIITKDGKYTVEVLTITPFNEGAPELLSHVTFTVDSTIRVNGSLTTAE